MPDMKTPEVSLYDGLDNRDVLNKHDHGKKINLDIETANYISQNRGSTDVITWVVFQRWNSSFFSIWRGTQMHFFRIPNAHILTYSISVKQA